MSPRGGPLRCDQYETRMKSFDEAFRANLRDLLVWRRDVRRFRNEPLPDGAPSRARVIAQRRTRAGGDDMLAWEDLFEREMRQAPDAPAGSLVARLTLPFDPTEPPGTFRLLILEEDRAFGPRGLMDGEGVRARVTFAEVVPLSRAVTRPVG